VVLLSTGCLALASRTTKWLVRKAKILLTYYRRLSPDVFSFWLLTKINGVYALKIAFNPVLRRIYRLTYISALLIEKNLTHFNWYLMFYLLSFWSWDGFPQYRRSPLIRLCWCQQEITRSRHWCQQRNVPLQLINLWLIAIFSELSRQPLVSANMTCQGNRSNGGPSVRC